MLTHGLRRCSIVSAASLLALAGLNPALANGPEVLDRVPSNAAMIGVVNNLQDSLTKVENFSKALNLPTPEGEEDPIADMKAILETPGLNKSGSVAIFVLADAEGKIDFESGEEPDALALIPVSDFKAFVMALGAEGSEGTVSVQIDENEQFVKSIGSGYAVMGKSKLLIEKFEGKSGNTGAHTKALGSFGASVLDSADAIFFADVDVLKPAIEKATEEMGSQAEMMSAMAGAQGEQAKAGIAIFQQVFANFGRDGETGMFVVDFTDKGVKLDVAAQFKEGSELAGFFSESGSSSKLLKSLPSQSFLFAGAVDTKVAGVRKILKNIAAMNAKAAKASGDTASAGTIATMLAQSENVDGLAFSMGANPAAMMGGGLLTNTTMFIATSDPAAYLAATQKALTGMNGTQVAGMKYTTEYKSKAVTIGGVDIDTWSTAIEPNPDDPNGMQIQMVQSMIFGPGGIGGMHAITEGGLVSTMSQNTPLMTSALEASKSGKGLADNALLKEAQKGLPEGRIFEVYLGTKAILDSVAGIMSMMGGAAEFTVPEQVSPVAMAGSAKQGGFAFHLFVPTDVVAALAEISKSMEAADQGDDMDMEEDEEAPAKDDAGANPRF